MKSSPAASRVLGLPPAVLAAAVLAAAAWLALPSAARAADNDPAAVKLVRGWESQLNTEGVDLTTTFTLVQKKPGETDRVLRVRTFRRDSADMYTIIFQYPDSEKGKGYLRRGDDLYFYLPSTREFVYRNRKDNIGSTDARTDLFGRQKILEQYTASLAGTATVSKWECDVVRLDARVQDVSYPVQKWYVRRTDGLPVKVENFSLSETLLATFYYVEYKALGNGKSVFTKLLAVNNLEKGQQTFLTNDAISISAIPDYTFTKPYLEEQSR
ncbi:MAG TPA: outer membrane lipoprotein-sorting protein [Spirochaetia bacterium]|nr:outer membrane lipoprotein-sorting protein [Spirochaetia bacterium]